MRGVSRKRQTKHMNNLISVEEKKTKLTPHRELTSLCLWDADSCAQVLRSVRNPVVTLERKSIHTAYQGHTLIHGALQNAILCAEDTICPHVAVNLWVFRDTKQKYKL